MKKKVVIVMGIMTAAFFLLQPVAGIFVGQDSYGELSSETETEAELMDAKDTTGIFDSHLGPKSSSESISGPFGTSKDTKGASGSWPRAPGSGEETEAGLEKVMILKTGCRFLSSFRRTAGR